jgi:hypothetical protein
MADLPVVIRHLKDFSIRFGEVGRSGRIFDFQPDDQARAEIASTLNVVSLPILTAGIELAPWMDGVEIRGRWTGRVVQTCGLSLEEFETLIAGAFTVQVLPPGSPNSPQESSEVVLDPDAADPPDVLESQTIDLSGYMIEHVALELDPFPRKPGAVFEPPADPGIISPFASLRDLKS